MNMRTTRPNNNKFYITKSKGGYSQCIQGKPVQSGANVLSNCVGYACGRFNEIIGTMKYPTLNCNAENFIERAKSLGLKVSNVPTLGGIMVWKKGNTLSGNDGAGHVSIVERIDSANQIYTSESNYGSTPFYNSLRTNSNGRWGCGIGYTFRGCIVNPVIGEIKAPTNNGIDRTIDELAKAVINGEFGTGNTRKKALGSKYNAVQARVNEILSGKKTTATKTVDQVAKEVLAGKWGNGTARKNALIKAGYNYNAVQARVNQLVKK